MYDNMEKFIEEIERLKIRYNENGPIFSGRAEIIAEIC